MLRALRAALPGGCGRAARAFGDARAGVERFGKRRLVERALLPAGMAGAEPRGRDVLPRGSRESRRRVRGRRRAERRESCRVCAGGGGESRRLRRRRLRRAFLGARLRGHRPGDRRRVVRHELLLPGHGRERDRARGHTGDEARRSAAPRRRPRRGVRAALAVRRRARRGGAVIGAQPERRVRRRARGRDVVLAAPSARRGRGARGDGDASRRGRRPERPRVDHRVGGERRALRRRRYALLRRRPRARAAAAAAFAGGGAFAAAASVVAPAMAVALADYFVVRRRALDTAALVDGKDAKGDFWFRGGSTRAQRSPSRRAPRSRWRTSPPPPRSARAW